MVPTSSDSRSAFVVASESVGGLGNLIGTAPGRAFLPKKGEISSVREVFLKAAYATILATILRTTVG